MLALPCRPELREVDAFAVATGRGRLPDCGSALRRCGTCVAAEKPLIGISALTRFRRCLAGLSGVANCDLDRCLARRRICRVVRDGRVMQNDGRNTGGPSDAMAPVKGRPTPIEGPRRRSGAGILAETTFVYRRWSGDISPVDFHASGNAARIAEPPSPPFPEHGDACNDPVQNATFRRHMRFGALCARFPMRSSASEMLNCALRMRNDLQQENAEFRTSMLNADLSAEHGSSAFSALPFQMS